MLTHVHNFQHSRNRCNQIRKGKKHHQNLESPDFLSFFFSRFYSYRIWALCCNAIWRVVWTIWADSVCVCVCVCVWLSTWIEHRYTFFFLLLIFSAAHFRIHIYYFDSIISICSNCCYDWMNVCIHYACNRHCSTLLCFGLVCIMWKYCLKTLNKYTVICVRRISIVRALSLSHSLAAYSFSLSLEHRQFRILFRFSDYDCDCDSYSAFCQPKSHRYNDTPCTRALDHSVLLFWFVLDFIFVVSFPPARQSNCTERV